MADNSLASVTSLQAKEASTSVKFRQESGGYSLVNEWQREPQSLGCRNVASRHLAEEGVERLDRRGVPSESDGYALVNEWQRKPQIF